MAYGDAYEDWIDRLGLGGTSGGGGDVSTSNAVALNLDQAVTQEGGALALPFGVHLIAGTQISRAYTEGADGVQTDVRFDVALGDGGMQGWAGVRRVYYSGEELERRELSDNSPGWHFHPGRLSTGLDDDLQGVDTYFPDSPTYSGTARLCVRLPEKFASESASVDKLRCVADCLLVPAYNSLGVRVEEAVPSNNNASVAAYFFDQENIPNDRIDWGSWGDWWEFCETQIPWGDRTIRRFECNVAFLADASLPEILDVICAASGTRWQDDGIKLRFITPETKDPIYHFYFDPKQEVTKSNISKKTVKARDIELKARPNRLIARFRDSETETLEITTVETSRPDLIAEVGEVFPGERVFPAMTKSQARRLLERMMRIESDNPQTDRKSVV
jgi:hypothetical protein